MSWTQSFDLTDGGNVLRIACGVFLVPHIFVKYRNQAFVKEFMANAGLRPPIVWLYGAFAVEIVASIGLILDAFTFYLGIVTAVFLLVAAWASWKVSEGKWIWNFGGAEYPLFWAIACLVVVSDAGA